MSVNLQSLDYRAIQRFSLIAWMAFVAGFALLNHAAPREFQRRSRLVQRILIALVFLCYAYVRSGPKGFGFLVVPVAAIILLGGRLVKDCPRCGTVVYNPYPFGRAQYCYACGAALKPRDLRFWRR